MNTEQRDVRLLVKNKAAECIFAIFQLNLEFGEELNLVGGYLSFSSLEAVLVA